MISDHWIKKGVRPLHVKDYIYHSPEGEPIVRKRRFALMNIADGQPAGKTFSVQHRPLESLKLGSLFWEPEIGPWGNGLLYRRPELDEAVREEWPICICEGEKDADNVAGSWGLTATSHYQGGAGWRPDQAEVLKGFHGQVFILMDNDVIGAQLAWRTYELLCEVGLQKGQYQFLAPADGYDDVSDHIAAGLGMKDMVPVPDYRMELFIRKNGRLPRGRAGYYGYDYQCRATEQKIAQELRENGWEIHRAVAR